MPIYLMAINHHAAFKEQPTNVKNFLLLLVFLLLILFDVGAQPINSSVVIKDYLAQCARQQTTRANLVDPQDSFDGITRKFNVEKREFEMELRIHFRLESFVGDSIALVEKVPSLMNEALRESERFFKHYGLNLSIIASFDLTQDYRPLAPPLGHVLVYLRPHRGGTMNILRWGVNPSWKVQRRAKIYTHELTHFFDIPDEYIKDHGFNTIAPMEADSYMKDWDHPNATMYLRHVKSMLDGFCE